MSRYFSADDMADIKNARGCNVPWARLAEHYCASVEELQIATGSPQWKELVQVQRGLFDDQPQPQEESER